jgi:hypothetical protein
MRIKNLTIEDSEVDMEMKEGLGVWDVIAGFIITAIIYILMCKVFPNFPF